MAKRKHDDEFYEELGYDETLEEFERSLGIDISGVDYDEFGCEACGNPFYPKCKTSCPLFDDEC